MQHHILDAVEEGIRAAEFLKRPESLEFIEEASLAIANCFREGGKVLIAGNGGSLCDAMHFAEELTGLFRKKRRALAAIAFSDPGHLTCIANDLGFESVFSRSIEALGKPGDIFVALTTSGNSPNILVATERAREMGLKTIAFLGKTGGKLKGMSQLEWTVEGFPNSDRIQEAHMIALHTIVQMVEQELFEHAAAELCTRHH